jgi:antitoxin component of RelBE/YafQ-DinJ toxin-antitoxin module
MHRDNVIQFRVDSELKGKALALLGTKGLSEALRGFLEGLVAGELVPGPVRTKKKKNVHTKAVHTGNGRRRQFGCLSEMAHEAGTCGCP